MTPASGEFPAFLKRSLAEFIPGLHRVQIWLVSVFPSLQVRFLTVPRVRARQMSSTVYWTFRKEIPFDAAQTIFDYGMEGDVPEEGTRKLAVTAYTVARAEVEQVRHVFDRAGLRLAGIVIPCFAMQNIARAQWLEEGDKTVMTVLMDEECSAALILAQGSVVLNRVFQTGMNALVGALRDHWPQLTAEQAHACIRWAGGGSGPPPTFTPPADQPGLLHVLSGALERVVSQVERSMSAYLVGRNEGDGEIHCVYVMGELAAYPRLIETMESHLGVKVSAFNPMDRRHLASRTPAPPEDAPRWALAVGAGLAHCASTPNLLHTYVERDKAQRVTRTNLVTVLAGGVSLVFLLAAFQVAGRTVRQLDRELNSVRAQLSQYEPRADRESVSRLASRVRERNQRARTLVEDGWPLALLNEVTLLTPKDIRLSSVRYVPAAAPPVGRGRAGDEKPDFQVQVEGRVDGPWGGQESKLTFYAVQLEDSPLFHEVRIDESGVAEEDGEQILSFRLNMRVSRGAVPPPKTGEGV
jgi:Tfp pilus assembly PilM family ATPase